MQTDINLRRGQPSDAEKLAGFAARIFAETFGPDNDPAHLAEHLARTYGELQQRAELADQNGQVLLLERDSVLCGYTHVRRIEPPPCVTGPAPIEIARFYIDRTWHGRGLAQRLMAAAEDATQELEGQTLWLDVWERNPRAIGFYHKSGFRDVGSVDFWLGPERQTDRIFVKSLRAAP